MSTHPEFITNIVTEETIEKIKKINEAYLIMQKLMDIECREMSIAKTNLEQAMLWAARAFALRDEKMNENIDNLMKK